MPKLDLRKTEPLDTPKTKAALVRLQATKALRLYLGNTPSLLFEESVTTTDINPSVDAFFRLRHLRPGEIETAIWCHGALVRKLKGDLDQAGFVGEGADVLQSVVAFLDLSGWWYVDNHWTSREECRASLQVTA